MNWTFSTARTSSSLFISNGSNLPKTCTWWAASCTSSTWCYWYLMSTTFTSEGIWTQKNSTSIVWCLECSTPCHMISLSFGGKESRSTSPKFRITATRCIFGAVSPMLFLKIRQNTMRSTTRCWCPFCCCNRLWRHSFSWGSSRIWVILSQWSTLW